MSNLNFLGTLSLVSETIEASQWDLEFTSVNGRPFLLALSGYNDLLLSIQIRTSDLSGAIQSVALPGTGAISATLSSDGDGGDLLLAGLSADTVYSVALPSGGLPSLSELDASGGGFSAFEAIRIGDDSLLSINLDRDGITLHSITGGYLNALASFQDDETSLLEEIDEVAFVEVSGAQYVIASSRAEDGVSSFSVESNSLSHVDSFSAEDGLGFATPTDLESVQFGDRSYVLLASEGSQSASTTLSVLEITSDGTIAARDHISVKSGSAFGLGLIATEAVGDRRFVATAGVQGVGLFEILANGTLIKHGSLAFSEMDAVDGATSIDMAQIGTTLRIGLGTMAGDAIGFASFEIPQGDALFADDLGGTLSGTGSDDALVDGAGSDTLVGGAGADVFVFTQDGETDVIDGYNPSEDRLDLSAWQRMYAAEDATVTSTSDGARIEFGDEVLVLFSEGGGALDAEDVRDSISDDFFRNWWVHIPEEEPDTGGGAPADDRAVASELAALLVTAQSTTLTSHASRFGYDSLVDDIARIAAQYEALTGRDGGSSAQSIETVSFDDPLAG
ncbi:hypothetical protein [Poseidonocella sedimentorum]|uniref:Uncharacterized protein n=1 Tax=Poseidonocella sedimentorum TaxID=871652 RepID=A0A1I6D649_9RHOB|nr:hypothetical protein [Poseidonocella sedimentorum]SFR00939.1 hypothetical protein SAMN04515673_102251 [Poseidonocella sedimentorum]